MKNIKAVYAGTFDPVTNGHLDIIERASRMYDHLYVTIFNNPSKQTMFTLEERLTLLKEVTSQFANVTVDSSEALAVQYAKKVGASVLVRGLRATMDFEYELQMSQTNRVIAPEIDTIFLTTNLKYSYLSSSIVKEIAEFDGDIAEFLHPMVAEQVRKKLDEARDRRFQKEHQVNPMAEAAKEKPDEK